MAGTLAASNYFISFTTKPTDEKKAEAVEGRYPVRNRRSEQRTMTKDSNVMPSATTRTLRNRTIVTTASTVTTKTRAASKSRARTQTFTKDLSSPQTKPATKSKFRASSKKHASPGKKTSKGKQSMVPIISPTSDASNTQGTPRTHPARPIVHQDTPDGTSIQKVTSGPGDKPKLFSGSTTRAFQLSNPNSPLHTPHTTPKRLSILHISFDKENTPPAPQVADEPSVIALRPSSPSSLPQNSDLATKDKPLKPVRKSLLPKRSSGLKRIFVNPSPSSPTPKDTQTQQHLPSTKTKTLEISKVAKGTNIASSPAIQKLDLKDTSEEKPSDQNLKITTFKASVKVLNQTGVSSTIDLNKEWQDKSVKDVQISPVKFHEQAPSHLEKPKDLAAISAPVASRTVLPTQDENNGSQYTNPAFIQPSVSRPKTHIIRSEYSLAPSNCSPLLATVLTRPLMQSSFYTQKSTSCQCRCQSQTRYSYNPQPSLVIDTASQQSPLAFLAAYSSSSDKCSRLWPDEGPDKEVERTMSTPLNPKSSINRPETLRNPIAVTFSDEPPEDYNFHPIHVPTKIIVQKAESAFKRIIVC